MKASLACPKCQSRQLWQIAEVRFPDYESSNATHPMCVTAVNPTAYDRELAGTFESWVCANCGFTEWYAFRANDVLARLAAIPNSGVRFIDTTPRQGPFR